VHHYPSTLGKGDLVKLGDVAHEYISFARPKLANIFGIVVSPNLSARVHFNLDNDDMIFEVLLPDGNIETVWEQDLKKIS